MPGWCLIERAHFDAVQSFVLHEASVSVALAAVRQAIPTWLQIALALAAPSVALLVGYVSNRQQKAALKHDREMRDLSVRRDILVKVIEVMAETETLMERLRPMYRDRPDLGASTTFTAVAEAGERLRAVRARSKSCSLPPWNSRGTSWSRKTTSIR